MSDLTIDNELLRRVRETFAHIDDLLEKPARSMDDVDAKAMGVAELEKRMGEFGDEWKYGIKELKKFSQKAAKALDKIEGEFSGLDHELADQLEKAANKK